MQPKKFTKINYIGRPTSHTLVTFCFKRENCKNYNNRQAHAYCMYIEFSETR